MLDTPEYKVPVLRFPEFKGDWNLETLGDYFTFKNGVNADSSAYGRGHKFINVLDIISDIPITYDRILDSVDISDEEFKKNEVLYGDILFQRSSETREEVGQSNVYIDAGKPATFGGFVIRGRPIKKQVPEYFHYVLKTSKVRKDMTSRSGGSTRYNIGQESLSKVSVNVAPTIPEQQKIAVFLGASDEKISQLTEKKALLQDYKKGVMQQIFSQEIRFRDDNGDPFPDWKKTSLGQAFEERGEKGIGDLELLSVTLSDGVIKRSDLEGKDNSSSDKSNYKRVMPGDIAYNSMRMWQGASGVSSFEGIVSPAYTVLKPRKGIHPIFFGYLFKLTETINTFQRYSQGLTSDTWNLKYKALSTIKLLVPSYEEQQKIAGFLTALDKKIEAVQNQLNFAQEFKKGLLQQMFV